MHAMFQSTLLRKSLQARRLGFFIECRGKGAVIAKWQLPIGWQWLVGFEEATLSMFELGIPKWLSCVRIKEFGGQRGCEAQ
jgi:hypothetical protein